VHAPRLEITDSHTSSSKKQEIKVVVPLSRLFTDYVVDHLLPLAFIVLTSGSVFFFPLEEGLGERAAVVMSVVLTIVAFKFMTEAKIPPVPYVLQLLLLLLLLRLYCYCYRC